MKIFIRLLRYEEAVNTVNWFNALFDKGLHSFASIEVGGITLKGTEKEIEQAIDFLEENYPHYELNLQHPLLVHKSLKAKNTGQENINNLLD